MVTSSGMSDTRERKEKAYLSLLKVSRQIYVETVTLPFQLNTFHADTPEVLKKWASTLPLAAR